MKSRSDDFGQLDLFGPRAAPKRTGSKKAPKSVPASNVIKLGRRRRGARAAHHSAAIAVMPPCRMRGEVAAAVRSMLDVPPAKWPEQRERCGSVFAELLAGVPSELRRRAVDQFLDTVDVDLVRHVVGERQA